MLSRTVRFALPLLGVIACAGRPSSPTTNVPSGTALPDMRTAIGRPPVFLVVREGDPAAAVAVAITTSGLGARGEDDPEAATALAGVLEARLRRRSPEATVTPAWDGLRASLLALSATDAVRFAEDVRDAAATAITGDDVVAARKKLAALALRPLRDRALSRWARCVGLPYAAPERAGRDHTDLDAARLERWRQAALGLGRVSFAVTGPSNVAEHVATTVLRGAPWRAATPLGSAPEAASLSVEVFEVATETPSPAPTIHATIDVGSSSAAVTAAEALGDSRGPLAARLSELDLPFRVREIVGAGHPRGGCVGVVLEGAAGGGPADLAARVADAAALVQLEAAVHLAEVGGADGRLLARRSGDAREAAERAAWWALVDSAPDVRTRSGCARGRCPDGSIALGVPSRRGRAADAPLEPTKEALSAAVTAAAAAWDKPIVDARSRVEVGQGEVWVLFGSPCGVDGETEAEAGLTALVAASAANGARLTGDARIEPWAAVDGAGVLVHGPALAGETPTAHARRLTDIAARSFAAEPIGGAAITHARADLLRRDARGDGAVLTLLAGALAPQHPSWIVPWGTSEPLARSSDGAVLARAQALRTGPLRVAILANSDTAQADAAVRAADRWVARRANERTCRAPTAASPPKPGTYAAPSRGTVPEAYLAFPFPAGDETSNAAAALVAAALEGDGGLLERALSDTKTPLARESSARVLGFPRAPALVVRVVAPEAGLDAAVMQARALLERLHKGGLGASDLDRAQAARARLAVAGLLDPRARVVATWRGSSTEPRATNDDARAFAQKYLTEDTMVVVASRPARPVPDAAVTR